MKQNIALLVTLLICMNIFFQSCKKELTDIDVALYNESKSTTGFTYYKNDATIKPKSNESPHSKYFRVRFNAIAQAALTDNGKLPAGSTFPEGSLIVKELYDSPTADLKFLAIMKKESANENAVDGWLWLEIKGDGGAYISSKEKGSQCVSCHSTNDRDYTRLFDLF